MVRRSGEDTKRQVKDANAIEDVVRSYGVELKRAGRNWTGLCPFHQERTASFNVSPEGQFFRCFGCGKAGDVFTFVMEHERVEFRDALEILAQRAGIELQHDPAAVERSRKEGDWKSYLYKLNEAAARYFVEMLHSPAGQQAREYLERRQINQESCERFRLGYAPGSGLVRRLQALKAPGRALEVAGVAAAREDGTHYDYFRDRVIFPITDVQGRVIAFGGRVLGDGEPKYLNTRETPLFSKSRTIYGLCEARAKIVETRKVFLVEGYTDVIMCHQHGFQNVVAALGTAITADHVRALRRQADELHILTDSDAAGARAAERSIEVLFQEGEDEKARIVRLPGAAKDPCDFLLAHGAEAFRAALEQGQSLFDHKFQQVAAQHNVGAVEGQAAAARELMALVSLAPDELRRGAYRREVAHRLRLSEGSLSFAAKRAPAATTAPAGAPAGPQEGLPKPEHPLAHAERLLLAWMMHQPAWIETVVAHVDLTQFRGTPERLSAMALLDAVAAGRLPLDLRTAAPDAASEAERVAGEILAGLQADAGLFDGGKVVDEADLARARHLCVVLAGEAPDLRKTTPQEHYDMLLAGYERERLGYELEDAKRAVAAARTRGDAGETEDALRREHEARTAARHASLKTPRRPKIFGSRR